MYYNTPKTNEKNNQSHLPPQVFAVSVALRHTNTKWARVSRESNTSSESLSQMAVASAHEVTHVIQQSLLQLLGAGGEEREQAGAGANRQHVVQRRRERAENVKAEHDHNGQEERIVVEDGEGGRLVVGDLVLLPQGPADTQVRLRY